MLLFCGVWSLLTYFKYSVDINFVFFDLTTHPSWHHLISSSYWKLECGCVPLSQSKSRFCDRKFDFLFHWRPNQSKIAIRTIYLRTWIVQIGISIWFEIGPLLCDQSFFRCSFRLTRKSNQSGLSKSKNRLAKRIATCMYQTCRN